MVGRGGRGRGKRGRKSHCSSIAAFGLELCFLVALLRPTPLPFFCRVLADSMAQLSPFEVGQVKAHIHHGLGPAEISRLIVKSDGQSTFSHTAISHCIAKLEADPLWRGERAQGSGRPRETTRKQDKQIGKMVLKWRGRVKVTVAWLKKEMPWLRQFSDSLVEERLAEIDLRWLRRRKKSLVSSKYIIPRIRYCKKVIKMHQKTLDRWAYSDGTVFFLDPTAAANEQTQRRALGPFVWRKADRSDALYADCVGPSCYNKAQGAPVRIWGVLAEGVLHIEVLDEGTVMNKEEYSLLVDEKFEGWIGNCNLLVQDYEKAIRSQEALDALQRVGLEHVKGYPVSSQDFNAIENAWKILRERLDQTLPKGVEPRDHFVLRVRETVHWVNKNRADELQYHCRNQKERARACLDLEGARTQF